jgi:hypothetical protein
VKIVVCEKATQESLAFGGYFWQQWREMKLQGSIESIRRANTRTRAKLFDRRTQFHRLCRFCNWSSCAVMMMLCSAGSATAQFSGLPGILGPQTELPASPLAAGDEHWDRQFGVAGCDTPVNSVATNGTDLYIAGYFNLAGGTLANRIARWDGTRWSALGGGMAGAGMFVYGLAVQGSNLYAGGSFTNAGGVAANSIARWDGTQWHPLGSGVAGNVYRIAASGNDVYASGTFSSAGGVPAHNIAKWDGTNWSALSSGLTGFTNGIASVIAFTLLVDDSKLYVGGVFTNAGGIDAMNIACWDGTRWAALGSGLGLGNGVDVVATLLKRNGVLYAGGGFGTAGGLGVTNIAKWDGVSWMPVGNSLQPYSLTNGGLVYALTEWRGDLYAGGRFTNPAGVIVGGIARWDGAAWLETGGDLSVVGGGASVIGMAAGADGRLYVGGFFGAAGDIAANNLARWDGASWSGFGGGQGASLSLRAILVHGSELFVGGLFTSVGDVPASRVARWDGTRWTALGSGVKGINQGLGTAVSALAHDGQYLYVGGTFTNAGGITASNIARWNGTSWAAVGSGANSNVLALAYDGGTLYAGGAFTRAGGVAVNHVAQWDGASWSAMGAGMNSNVLAISATPDGVFAGGSFTNAGGVLANGIAKWSTLDWASLGGLSNGVNGSVNAILQVAPTVIYVGGTFTFAGGVPANHIAQWGSTGWTALGAGLGSGSASVSALAPQGGNIYAGGSFTNTDARVINRIAKWDGANWLALGSGVRRALSGGSVAAIAVDGDDVYVGGSFAVAGEKGSFFFGHWNEQKNFDLEPLLLLTSPQRQPGGPFQFTLVASNIGTYTIEAFSTLTNWTAQLTNTVSPYTFQDAVPGLSRRFYRARQLP